LDTGMVDIHAHLLPGIDDGARDIQASREILALYRTQGVTDVVCTPHLPYPADANLTAEDFRSAVERRDRTLDVLRASASVEFPGISLHAGAELILSSYLPGILKNYAQECALAGSQYLLVESPVFVPGSLHALDRMLFSIQLAGFVPVLAHPERMKLSRSDLSALLEWVDQDRLLLQVNAGTLLPADALPADRRDRHRQRQEVVDPLFAAGAVHVVASDTHGPDMRPPVLDLAHAVVSAKYGPSVARRLFFDNPKCILEGGDVT
jgi:protein-tyrosine phosphatase